MQILKKTDFYNTLFKLGDIPECYESISLRNEGKNFQDKKKGNQHNNKLFSAYAITLFPQYFTYHLCDKDYTCKKITQYNLEGFAINTSAVSNIEEYLMNLKSKYRSTITNNLRRLEHCFDVEYEIFFGDNITKNIYQNAMVKLKNMLETRFKEKNDTTEVLEKWDSFKAGLFDKIKKKEASLFITYASKKIIGISINYHANQILKGEVISYDINYAKFGLGHVMVYKVLEWCFNNNYLMMDMGNGNLKYKRVWCNLTYGYEYHFIYNKKSVPGTLVSFLQIYIIKIKNLLKKWKINDIYIKIKTSNKNTNTVFSILPNYRTEQLHSSAVKSCESYTIDFTSSEYSDLSKPINNFLYSNKEQFNKLKVYKLDDETFIFAGSKNYQKVIFEKR